MPIAQSDLVVILDAVPANEARSARRLKEDIEDASVAADRQISVRIEPVKTIRDLRTALGNLEAEIYKSECFPWLHLDGHGVDDESGFITGRRGLAVPSAQSSLRAHQCDDHHQPRLR